LLNSLDVQIEVPALPKGLRSNHQLRQRRLLRKSASPEWLSQAPDILMADVFAVTLA
jgi:hypothetical protein